MSSKKLRIIVGGLVGQYPLGGVAWDYFHYVLGLHELGHDVYYHEDTWVWPFDPIKGFPTDDPNYTVNFIRDFFDTYAPHLADKWHFLLLHEKSHGMSREAFDEVARTADVFLNVSGACFFPDHLSPKCKKVFLDTDPGYNQIMLHERFPWSQYVDRWCKQVEDHDVHLSYAENIHADDCVIPRMNFDWRPTRCVATLAPWNAVKAQPPPDGAPFTTVMTWNWYGGKLEYKGVEYEQKVREYDKFHDLPRRTDVPLALCVGGHKTPYEQIRRDGWQVIDAHKATLTPTEYLKFVQSSAGEWSVAKNVYTATNSGWFSCRTACYLAAGRPAVVQDTKWSRYVPSGKGVIAFDTMEQTLAALKEVNGNWIAHSVAAYDVAREYLAPDRVLPTMIQEIFAPKRGLAVSAERTPL
jgi:hypothetical protein